MEGKIQILKVEDDSGEPSACWRTDRPELASQFFDYIAGYDYDPEVKVVVEWVTPDAWDAIDKLGKEYA